MHIDPPRLTVMDLTANHCWVGVRFHLKAGYTVPMDVTALKVTLGMDRRIQNDFILRTCETNTLHFHNDSAV